ncbi:MAG: HmuY family protein [Crocinitomicaceae bacterium]|nr:HmuY family protein [Crocinitomicaceae bacterium]
MKAPVPVIILCYLFLHACMKEDKPIPSPQPGNIESVMIEIGYPYLNQVYFSCENNEIVSTNTKFDWDLGFECGPNGFHIIVNTARGTLVANAGELAFEDVQSSAGLEWTWDRSSGDMDSTAFGEWLNSGGDSRKEIFIVDRQSDSEGNNLPMKKIRIDSVSQSSYYITYANLDNSQLFSKEIPKDNSRNFISFSFDNEGEVKTIEPPSTDWDLCFTNYQHYFSNLPLPFVITGVLSNRKSGIVCADIPFNGFEQAVLADTALYVFTNRADEIGYDWKIRNDLDNSYTIDENKFFMLKNQQGVFYKIRFTDFYDQQGNKGYPTFLIQKM